MPGRPRWKVAIVDDDAPSVAAVATAIRAGGGEIIGEAARAADGVALVARLQPDVAIFAVGLAVGDGLDAASRVTARAICPVVLLTGRSDAELATRARDAGVMGFLLKPLRPAELAPALDLAVARFADVRELRQSLADRKVVERAKGRLMVRHGLPEDEAYQRLRRAAMDERRPIAEIAAAVLTADAVAAHPAAVAQPGSIDAYVDNGVHR